MSLQESPPPAAARPFRAGSRVAHFAMLAGLTALVPLPFVDVWLERRAHRAMFRALAADAGQPPLDEAAIAVLTEDRSSFVLGCLGTAVVWPVKKLFRTFFYFLTVKDVIDGIAEATLRAAMVRAAFAHLPHDARNVRDVMDATLDRHQFSPVSRAFFRGERPDAAWVADTDRVDRTVAWVYKKAGGGAILGTFAQRLGVARQGASVLPDEPPSEVS
jgi:hypothetical protein